MLVSLQCLCNCITRVDVLAVTRNRVQDVLVVADMLQMVDVKRACVNFMLTHLDVDNCIGTKLYYCSTVYLNTEF